MFTQEEVSRAKAYGVNTSLSPLSTLDGRKTPPLPSKVTTPAKISLPRRKRKLSTKAKEAASEATTKAKAIKRQRQNK
jgi:hypothetical protein